MKKVKLFEDFLVESTNTKEIAQKILNVLDENSQLYPDFEPKEALKAIESGLKKGKMAAKQIRLNLEDIGILANELSPTDVESLIMSNLNESKYNGNVAGDAAEYIAKELSMYVKGIIDQSNDKQTFFHLKDKSYKNKVIKTLKDIYGLDAFDGGTEFSPSPTIKFDNDAILESTVNEAKEISREDMMDLLDLKYKIKTVRTSEEFNGQIDGIWLAADNEEELSGNKIFDYYNRSAQYSNGILKQVKTAVEKNGWRFEWNDPGTIMCWPNN